MQPLQSLHVVEFEGLGPGPLAGLMLAGLGARVTVLVRPGAGAVQIYASIALFRDGFESGDDSAWSSAQP